MGSDANFTFLIQFQHVSAVHPSLFLDHLVYSSTFLTLPNKAKQRFVSILSFLTPKYVYGKGH